MTTFTDFKLIFLIKLIPNLIQKGLCTCDGKEILPKVSFVFTQESSNYLSYQASKASEM